MENTIANQSRIANLSDKHCVFQCGDTMFSIPATSVREVTILPTVVRVPCSHPSLSGLGNLRSEFLPVIDLEPLIGDQARLSAENGQLIVIECPLGSWAIAIDKVIAIDGIETHIDAGQRSENTTSALMGTASYDGKVISVLDVNGLQRIAQQAQESLWQHANRTNPSNVPSSTSTNEWNAV